MPEKLFEGNTQLKELNLGYNQLGRLSSQLIKPLIHLHQLNVASNWLEEANWLLQLPPALNRLALRVDLSSNHLRSMNLSSLNHFQYINLADNRWDCSWLARFMLRSPPPIALNFQRAWPMLSGWNEDLLSVRGIDCFDGRENRSIILIDVSTARQPDQNQCDCVVSAIPSMIFPLNPKSFADNWR